MMKDKPLIDPHMILNKWYDASQAVLRLSGTLVVRTAIDQDDVTRGHDTYLFRSYLYPKNIKGEALQSDVHHIEPLEIRLNVAHSLNAKGQLEVNVSDITKRGISLMGEWAIAQGYQLTELYEAPKFDTQ